MASTPYNDLTNDWSPYARYSVAEGQDVLISNPSGQFLFFAITHDAAPPEIEVRRSNPIGPLSNLPITLPEGGWIWLGGVKAFANIEAFAVVEPVAPVLSAPANSVAPTVTPSGQVDVGVILTCAPGTWTGNPAPTFAYRWLRDGTNIAPGLAALFCCLETAITIIRKNDRR